MQNFAKVRYYIKFRVGNGISFPKIPWNRLGTVSFIPQKKVLILRHSSSAEEPIPKFGTEQNGTEFREKMKFYGTE